MTLVPETRWTCEVEAVRQIGSGPSPHRTAPGPHWRIVWDIWVEERRLCHFFDSRHPKGQRLRRKAGMIHIAAPVAVTFLIACSAYERAGFDDGFFNEVFVALVASVFTSFVLWVT
jgi:hypothetical protein